MAAFISHKFFSLKLAKILRPPFLKKIYKRLLLERLNYMRQRSFFFYQNQWSYSGSMFSCFLGFSLQKILLLVLRQSSSNYKIGNSVTLLVNPFPHRLWFFVLWKPGKHLLSIVFYSWFLCENKFRDSGFYTLFLLPRDKFLPVFILMFAETSNIDEAHCSQAQSISQWAVGNWSSESRMLRACFLSFQEDTWSVVEFYEKIYIYIIE